MGFGIRRAAAVTIVCLSMAACPPFSREPAAPASSPPAADPVYAEYKPVAQALASGAHVHGPVRRSACSACHADAADLKKLTAQEPDLCFGCHAATKAEGGKEFVHLPFGGGSCSGCHDPHSSEVPKLLLKAENELCGMCHDLTQGEVKTSHGGLIVSSAPCSECHAPHASGTKKIIWDDNLHMPFASGMCESCHTATEEGKPKLSGDGGEMCGACHADAAGWAGKKHVHFPFGAGQCVSCHSAHRGKGRDLLAGRLSAVCGKCHDGIPLAGHPVGRHPAENMELKNPKQPENPMDCAACHDPHASDFAAYGRAERKELCLWCHTK